jgi:hypothetical protein
VLGCWGGVFLPIEGALLLEKGRWGRYSERIQNIKLWMQKNPSWWMMLASLLLLAPTMLTRLPLFVQE